MFPLKCLLISPILSHLYVHHGCDIFTLLAEDFFLKKEAKSKKVNFITDFPSWFPTGRMGLNFHHPGVDHIMPLNSESRLLHRVIISTLWNF